MRTFRICLLMIFLSISRASCAKSEIDQVFKKGVEFYNLHRDYEAINCFIAVDSLCQVVYNANDIRNEYHKVYLCKLLSRTGHPRGRDISENYGFTPVNMLRTKNIDKICNNALREFELGNYQQAIKLRESAAIEQKKILGDSSFCYINSLLFIGSCLDSLKDYSQAILILKEALDIQYRILDSTTNCDKVLNTLLRINTICHKDSIFEREATKSYIEYAKALMNSSYYIAIWDGNIGEAVSNAELALDMISKHFKHDSRDYLDQLYRYSGIIGLKMILSKEKISEEEQNRLFYLNFDLLKDYELTCFKLGYTNHHEYLESLSSLADMEEQIGDTTAANRYTQRLLDLIYSLDPISIVESIDLVVDPEEMTIEQKQRFYDPVFLLLDSTGMHYSESYIKLLEKLDVYYMTHSPEKMLDNCLSRIEIKRHISPNEVDAYAERKLLELSLLVSFSNIDDMIKIQVEEARRQHHYLAYGKDIEYVNIISNLAYRYAEIRQFSKAKSLFNEALDLMSALKMPKKQRSAVYKNMVYLADFERNSSDKEYYVEKTLEGFRNVENEEELHTYLSFLKEISTQWELQNLPQYHEELINAYKHFKLIGVAIDKEYAYEDEAMFYITFYRWFNDIESKKSPEVEYYGTRVINYYRHTNNMDVNRRVIERVVEWLSSYYYIMGMNKESSDLIEFYIERFPTRKEFNLYRSLVRSYQAEGISVKAEKCLNILSQMVQDDAIPIVLYNTTSKRTLIWNDYLEHINFIESHFYPEYFDYLSVGLGIVFHKDGGLFIVNSVIPNSPADISGITEGDVIKKINDISIDESFSSSDVRKMIKGAKGTLLSIELNEASGNIKSLVIERNLLLSEHLTNLKDEDLMGNMYNLSLLRKNFLLMANLEFEKAVEKTGDKLLKEKYMRLSQQRHSLQTADLNQIDEKTYNKLTKELEEDEFSLMNEISQSNDFFSGAIVDYKQIRDALKPNEVAIEFVHYVDNKEDKYAAIAMTSDSKNPFFVTQFIGDILAPLTSSNHSFDNNDAKLISNLIWEPLYKIIPNIKTIFFSPDGIINILPIENSLSTNIKYPNSNFYRLSSTRQICNRGKRKESIADMVLFGGISYGANIHEKSANNIASSRIIYSPKNSTNPIHVDSLTWSQTEIDSIYKKGIKHNIHIRKHEHNDATEKRFKQLSETDINIVHIATHGFFFNTTCSDSTSFQITLSNDANTFEDNSMTNTGLLFAGVNYTLNNNQSRTEEEDGLLTSYEVASLHFPHLSLVSLSACQTGLGNINSEGVYGLQRGFKKAGANSILMSLWKVDDYATSILMTKFYEYFFAGYNKRESLKMAQNDLRNYTTKRQKNDYIGLSLLDIANENNDYKSEEVRPYESPYYWASFILLDGLY